jgi:hypothetical protein
MPPDQKRDYEVGYRKPPRTRFPKGQSGNPRDRLTGPKNLKALLSDALNEFVIVTENGGCRKITKREAIITQLVNRSASRFSRDQDPPRHGAGYRRPDRAGICRDQVALPVFQLKPNPDRPHVLRLQRTRAPLLAYDPLCVGSAGGRRLIHEVRFARDSPLEEAVTSELVSEAKFPASREFTGNFIASGLRGAPTAAKTDV